MGLLGALARHEVDYLVIGGVAAQLHGRRRTTKDLDVMPAPGRANLERLAAALEELDARAGGIDPGAAPLSVTDVDRLEIAPVLPPLRTRHGELHVVKEPEGADDYGTLRQRALVVPLEGLELAIVALDDLVRMKRAAGRRRDLEDIDALIRLERDEHSPEPPAG